MSNTMRAQDAIAGSLGECYVTINGKRYFLMQLLSVEASMDKTKTKVSILGKSGKGNKSAGWEGTGTAKLHYCTSIFRELLYKYKETGEDIYFEMQVTNEDPSSAAGRQTTTLIGCNLNGGTIAKIDADAETLDEDIEFTFEDWELPEKFATLSGMQL